MDGNSTTGKNETLEPQAQVVDIPEKRPRRRDWRLDLVRALAIFEVISVHFLLNNGFYGHAVVGGRMGAMVLLRAVSITCVPLFMLLTGYLVRGGECSKRFYSKLGSVFYTYVAASLICLLYSALVNGEQQSLLSAIVGILGFKAAPYSWYVEMYIGLFLLIPFLGSLWNALSKRMRLVLIATVFAVSFLPNVTNVYVVEDPSWWAKPSSSTAYDKLLPAWWLGIYPVGYYFAGRWLAEYGLPLNKAKTAGLLIVCVIALGAFDWWRSHGAKYIWGEWNAYGSLLVAAIAILIFWGCMLLPEKRPRIAGVLEFISRYSLGAYLVSWIWDQTFYPLLADAVSSVPMRLEWYFAIVPAVFVCSIITAFLIEGVKRLTLTCYRKVSTPKEHTS